MTGEYYKAAAKAAWSKAIEGDGEALQTLLRLLCDATLIADRQVQHPDQLQAQPIRAASRAARRADWHVEKGEFSEAMGYLSTCLESLREASAETLGQARGVPEAVLIADWSLSATQTFRS